MRTLLLAPALFSSDGGIERMMRLYLKALCDIATPDDSVTLATLNDDLRGDGRIAAYSTPVLRHTIAGRRRRIRFSVAVVLAARHCDRVVCGHVNLLPLVRAVRLMNPSLEVHLIAHGVEAWRPWTRAQRRALRARDRVIAVSEFTRQRVLEQRAGIHPDRTRVVPNALDPNLPTPAGRRTPGLIVTLSRLSASDRYKGVDHLIETMPTIRTACADARLLVIGDGDDHARLERLAAKRAPGAVEFAGRLPDRLARERLAAAALFALPSRDEGFGLVYVEALSLGIPCVAARSGGASEVVDESVGTLVEYGHTTQLAAACVAALRRTWDPSELRRHASRFSYPMFRDRLSEALNSAQ